MTLESYRALIASKRIAFAGEGLQRIPALNAAMFPHQAHSTEFALRKGRAALFLDTGLGKSLCALDWGRIVVEETNKPVLMLAPLAVAQQHAREADRFGIDVAVVRSGEELGSKRIYITNYDRLDKFDPDRFGGVILDESSILKSFTGKTTRRLIEAFGKTRFRLACTATPAPNDHTELGTHSEFLGAMRRDEMLPIWFINDTMDTGTWRVKGHARENFWSWVASWSRCISKPSDIGFDDGGFALPPLEIIHHEVSADRMFDPGEEKKGKLAGQQRLFRIPDTSATSIHKEKRLTIASRAKKTAEIVFRDFELWAGNQNTQQLVAQNIGLIQQSATGENLKGARRKKTPSICDNITSATKKNTSEARRSKPDATQGDANATHLIQNSERNAKRSRKQSVQSVKEQGALKATTGLRQNNTTDCLSDNNSNARSADQRKQAHAESDCTSIIATQQEECVVSCAPTAIKASANSETISNGSSEPQNTSRSERDWWVVWCDTDYEQDALEAEFGDAAISIRGSHPSFEKEYRHEAWLRGDRKILICKPVMFGYGLNWQHCCKQIFCGLSFSYEAFYQAIRRSWRFGQKRSVQIHVVCADTERAIWAVVERKSGDHDAMKREMVAAMRRSMNEETSRKIYAPTRDAALPAWLA